MTGERPLTEAEYRALLPSWMRAIADELSERFADVLPEGMRFEWTWEGDDAGSVGIGLDPAVAQDPADGPAPGQVAVPGADRGHLQDQG